MKLQRTVRVVLAILVVAGLAASGCGPDQTEPANKGQRGEACQARNDCGGGLACINGICSRNDFEIEVTAKHCDRVDCSDDEDCCGDKPTQAPAKCANRVSVCETPQVPDCIQTTCESADDCGDGTCGAGRCSLGLTVCTSDGQCQENLCTNGVYCDVSLTACTTDDQCVENTCANRICDCSNPDFNPADPICTDEDCIDVCTLSCEDERCVPDTSCETDIDCAGLALNICDDGRCVECVEDEDCDEDDGEECVRGRCDKPCEEDEECPLFHQCDDGDCIEVGCRSNRECVLAANQGLIPNQVAGASDARLAECLEPEGDSDVSVCRIPCENDGECGSQLQLCEEGFCKFIGCETDEECRTHLGIANEDTNDEKPYVSKAVCRE